MDVMTDSGDRFQGWEADRCRRTVRARGAGRAWRASALLVASSLLLAACTTSDPLAEQASVSNTNYVAGDGSVSEFAAGGRSAVPAFDAALEDGTRITASDLQGQVTVLNFWYAACAPCRVEAPDLEALNQEFTGQRVQFLGVNLRDQQATASAFERSFGITYPSVLDADGSVVLSLSEFVPPQAVPTTLVIDKDGRIAARILGIADKAILRSLITTALETSG